MPSIVSIDPGLTGAIALITIDQKGNVCCVELHSTPTRTVKIGSKMVNTISIVDMLKLLSPYDDIAIEEVGAFGKDGRKSAFSFGGAVHTMYACFKEHQRIHAHNPKDWKMFFNLIGKHKRIVIDRYKQLSDYLTKLNLSHGNMMHWLQGRSEHTQIAFADALLLGMYHLHVTNQINLDDFIASIKQQGKRIIIGG